MQQFQYFNICCKNGDIKRKISLKFLHHLILQITPKNDSWSMA